MSETVTVPSLMVMTSIVSEESFARDTHTDTDKVWSIVNVYKEEEKEEEEEEEEEEKERKKKR